MAQGGIIDVHHHILPPFYLTALGERIGTQGLTGSLPDWSPSISLEAMDRNSIAAAVTSISSPGIHLGDPAATKRLARACNDYAASLKRDHPKRFGFFAVLPLPDVDASLVEIEHAFDVLGADGVGLLTNYGGVYPGDTRLAPIFAELERRKAVIFFHPTASAGWEWLPDIPVPTLEFPFDTTRAVVSMLLGGTFTHCPKARFIFSHAGGTVPFLTERIARLSILPQFQRNVPDGVRAVLRRLYFDLALASNPLAFSTLMQVTDCGQLLFGSDYPHAREKTMADMVNGIKSLPASDPDYDKIARGNAIALFPTLAQR